MGLGRSDGMDGVRRGKSGPAERGREEGDPDCLPGRAGEAARRRDSPAWGLFYTFYTCYQRNLSP